jgi:Protein of unknown function (DUF3710)
VFRRRRREDADQPGSQDLAVGDDPEFEDDPEGQDDGPDGGPAGPDDGPEGPDHLEGQRGLAGRRGAARRPDQLRQEARVNLGDPDTWTRSQRVSAGPAAGGVSASGPWDGAAAYPERERMDFGSLLIPATEGIDIQINMAEEQGVWIAVVRGESGLQLQAFAAPKTSGLWDEVRQEIAEEVDHSGGDSEEADGPFGTELHARVNPAVEGQPRQQLQPVRFIGVDGPRWFLRGVISGPAARRAELGRPFEEVFADVVVVRGDHPAPPRDLLEIRLPEEARQALEEQMAQDAEGQMLPNPFERGPEITETR